VRFGVGIGGNSISLWEAAADGGNPHPLLPGWNQPPNECCGRWMPDGKHYVFQSTRSGRTDLWALPDNTRADSRSEPVRLTQGPLNMLSPFPSPAGKKIYAVGQQQVGELVRYDSHSHEFVPFLDGISAEGVTFSRDGRWVAYVTYPAGTLWRSRVDGSDKLQLTEPPMIASVPVWSPDGKQIAFVGSAGEHPAWQIDVISADGGSPQQLTFGDQDQFSPWWSPDSSRLVYSRHSWTDTAISVMELTSRSVTTIPNSGGFCCPAWSRDGKHLFAAATSPPRLMMYDMAEKKWSELWRGVFDYYDVSHDGSYLYFDSVWQYDPAVYRLRIRDRKLEKVVSLKNFRRTRGANGYWFDLAPDDSPLLLRNLSTEQLYELDIEWP
jgi:Tol biopolymer transport system component